MAHIRPRLGQILCGATRKRKTCVGHTASPDQPQRSSTPCASGSPSRLCSKEVQSCVTVQLVRSDGESLNANSDVGCAGSDGADVRAVSHRAIVLWLVESRCSTKMQHMVCCHMQCVTTSSTHFHALSFVRKASVIVASRPSDFVVCVVIHASSCGHTVRCRIGVPTVDNHRHHLFFLRRGTIGRVPGPSHHCGFGIYFVGEAFFFRREHHFVGCI